MLITLEETSAMIRQGKNLHIAADDALLQQLPKGRWIGGTTPYFSSEEGGIFTKEKLFVTEIDFAEEIRIASYGKNNVFQIVEECYDNCLTLLIMPYGSEVANKYAKEAPEVEELLMRPTLGWISGFDLNAPGAAKVYNGETGESFTDRAVVMYCRLPKEQTVLINMINLFTDDKADPVIRFDVNELEVTDCTVDGVRVNFAEYIRQKGIDPSMPLVSDHNGSYLNTSIREVREKDVSLYAPVYRNIEYRFASHVDDYAEEFMRRLNEQGQRKPVFSCNCILNYQLGNLEGKKTLPFIGPVTFGEVAYQLMNQTLVYCEILG